MADRIHPRLAVIGLLLLTGSTGVLDAASYLALDKVFTGNMTGNVLFAAFALAGDRSIDWPANLIALAAFVAGSIIGGRVVGRGHPAQRFPRRSVGMLATSAAIVALLAIGWLVIRQLTLPEQVTVTVLLAIVCGAQSSAVKPIGNSDITTIVVTSTIANLARDSRIAGGRGQAWGQRLVAIVVMFVGAAFGAVAALQIGGGAALAISAIVMVAAILVLREAERRARPAS